MTAALCAVVVNALTMATGAQGSPGTSKPPTLAEAQALFYNARYEAAATLALTHRASQPQDLANDELRSSALLFQLKALLDGHTVKDAGREGALKACATCPSLIAEFLADVGHGQALARTRLQADPADVTALFFLGKLDLNYVWLQLGPLGRRTGWGEYWEARHSLDAVLKKDPQHVRAIVARAWIDYIVDTRMPWGTRWVLGGGSRKRALAAVSAAVQIDTDFFSHAEAEFALWNLRIREHDVVRATEVARSLAVQFPENQEVAAFLGAGDPSVAR